GLEEIEEEEGECIAHADYTDFGNMSHKFEELGIELKKATLERISNTPITLTKEELEEVRKIIDKLEEDEDVQAVYTNIK
ncbi:MAG: YebC/PmpR family DNA-binding transcriptional regulator, partial [Thiovulaceae bacterium]|nr:YebC/PmpR family DNA-binding transcriptional regulator [Sulfurimonadaceae bacterium]